MLVHDELKPADVIIVLCSYQPIVAEWAAELYQRELAPLIIFSGREGSLTKGKHDETEAARFAKVAIARGVPESAIVLEEASTNTGQNIKNSAQLLESKSIHPTSVILVQKPYMERRTLSTAMAQWPSPQPDFMVTSPQLSYEQYMQLSPNKDDSVNRMVGDLQRIMEYPVKGWSAPQDVPDEVKKSYDWLVVHGYDKQLA